MQFSWLVHFCYCQRWLQRQWLLYLFLGRRGSWRDCWAMSKLWLWLEGRGNPVACGDLEHGGMSSWLRRIVLHCLVRRSEAGRVAFPSRYRPIQRSPGFYGKIQLLCLDVAEGELMVQLGHSDWRVTSSKWQFVVFSTVVRSQVVSTNGYPSNEKTMLPAAYTRLLPQARVSLILRHAASSTYMGVLLSVTVFHCMKLL